MIRGRKITVKCKYCNKEHEVRLADWKRGWGRFCSKSCKGKWQCRNNPRDNFFNHIDSIKGVRLSDEQYFDAETHPLSSDALGQF